jgi:hypothetical protein
VGGKERKKERPESHRRRDGGWKRKKERSTPVSRRALRGHSVNEEHRARTVGGVLAGCAGRALPGGRRGCGEGLGIGVARTWGDSRGLLWLGGLNGCGAT